jgi:DHA2 family multidrug resistance protein-like MFS transporter
VGSIALNAGLFASFVLGCDWLMDRPAQGAALLALALVCGVGLVRRELPRAAPLIPLDLLRSHPFRISILASVCCFTGQMGATVAMPFYLQQGLGQSTLATGLLMTPWPLAVMLAAPLAGRLSDRLPTAWLCAGGGAVLALGLALCAAVPLQDHPGWAWACSPRWPARASASSRRPTTATCCSTPRRSAAARPGAPRAPPASPARRWAA